MPEAAEPDPGAEPRPAAGAGLVRRPYGPGWALVGDAGLVMDPITGQGIGDALRDAELLAEAVSAGLGGRRPLEGALAGYERARDRAVLPMYEFTGELASFAPPRAEQQALFAAVAGRPRCRTTSRPPGSAG